MDLRRIFSPERSHSPLTFAASPSPITTTSFSFSASLSLSLASLLSPLDLSLIGESLSLHLFTAIISLLSLTLIHVFNFPAENVFLSLLNAYTF
ncbi:unnamed protein product [Microthlaspi erraticum]|uniref:Uncharacterized protein n=1 Tax=Microthlaspi erraticum TaxID=1685480 RepID=A0A6D2K2J4_9BRAS|nr:unnamed protein product [Microthlaspi erraticum]